MSIAKDRRIVALRPEQARQAGAVLARAFHEDPFFTFVFSDPNRRKQITDWLFERIVRSAIIQGKAYATVSMDGVALWLDARKPSLGFRTIIRSGLFLMPVRLTLQEFMKSTRLYRCVDELHKRSVRGAHWYLIELGVEPSSQGRGLGSALLEPALSQLDEQGLSCFLDTYNERNLPFYERHGFRVSGREVALKGGPIVWGMLREAP
jgi:hypothetical protein